MTLQNVHHVEADIKRKTYLNEPHVTANDDIAFIVSITDDGAAVDMASVATVYLASERLDKQTVITVGTKLADGTIKFELGHTETQVPGQVKAVAQLFDSEGDRISSVAWTYIVDRDPTGEGYIPTEKDKTFIEVVLSEGPAVIQEAKDVTAAAQQSVVNADDATERANTAAAGAEAVVDEFATFKSSAAKAKEFSTVDDRFEELEKDGYIPMSNAVSKIIDSNNDGLADGWNSINSSIDRFSVFESSQRVENDSPKYAVIGAGSTGTNIADLHYMSATVRTNSGAVQLTIGNSGKSNFFVGNEVYNTMSMVSLKGNRETYEIFGGSTFVGYYEVKDVVGINLTKIFGAGNEPTKEQMDALLAQYPNSWFDGTVNLAENKKFVTFLLNQLKGKANKKQSEWIPVTLLNGSTIPFPTEPPMMRKDEFGIVHLKGRIRQQNQVSIFIPPAGYRPTNTLLFTGATGISNLVTRFAIFPDSTGVFVYANSADYFALDGIQYHTT